ncbi:methyltransferase domain-containing protein [Nostoc sp.]|uniref:methyltransferase domain-containing protein n=1 Tax=Nostoc sp. TaxID=1180 RepID=UPI002FF8CED0
MVEKKDFAVEIPIQIFVGTQEEQMLAVKVLEYSIRKYTSMPVEVTPLFAAVRKAGIHIPEPQDPKIKPRTPFSFQRFAIPALKNYRGRAIYLDSDMQVFRDIKELWLLPFNGADLLSVYEPENSGRPPQFSVMVINCEQLKWDVVDLVRDLERGKWTYKQFVLEMAPATKIAPVIPTEWNDLERYTEGKTALTHYTDMASQPWLTTENPLGWLWCQELFNAIKEGFISEQFLREEFIRGWIRPSLIYQLEHEIIDPRELPPAIITQDSLEFIPPHLCKKKMIKKNVKEDTKSPNFLELLARKVYGLAQYIWRASRPNIVKNQDKEPLTEQINKSLTLNKLQELYTLEPPLNLTKGHGGKQFSDIGHRWVETFKLFADLKQDENVLDVGCGPGRMALALARYLNAKGRYEGFDIKPDDIAWCQQEIEPRWSQSRFQLVNIKNDHYNPIGKIYADEFKFPYKDCTFDFVFLTSVFTHLLPKDLSNYLQEVVRVLKPGGRCLITYFLINEAVSESIKAGNARFDFPNSPQTHCYIQKPDDPEDTVGYDEEFIRNQYSQMGFKIQEPIYFGSWSGIQTASKPRHGQDVVVAVKAK